MCVNNRYRQVRGLAQTKKTYTFVTILSWPPVYAISSGGTIFSKGCVIVGTWRRHISGGGDLLKWGPDIAQRVSLIGGHD